MTWVFVCLGVVFDFYGAVYMRRVIVALATTSLVLALSPASIAQPVQAADRGVIRISEAVELPGLTLPPGEYEFKLLESPANRHIVQVHEFETGKVVTTLLSVPAERARTTDESVVPFAGAPADLPQPIRFWFLPGQLTGHEFVYPREQALAIARITGQRVLTAETTDTASMKTARVSTIDSSGRRTARRISAAGQEDLPRHALNTDPGATSRPRAAVTLDRAEVAASEPPVTVSQRVDTPGQAPAPAAELPDTGGKTAWLAMAGLLAMAGALAAGAHGRRAS